MLRVQEKLWVNVSSIVSLYISRSTVLIQLVNSETEEVDDKFLSEVCSTLNIPYNLLLAKKQ